MRTFFKVVLFFAVCIAFVACGGDDDKDSGSSVSSVSGKISGTLLTGADSVLCYVQDAKGNDVVLSKCPVGSDGSFSVEMPVPAYTEAFDDETLNNPDLTISDRSAKTQPMDLIYKNDYEKSYPLLKRNYAGDFEEAKGDAEVDFMYSDKDFTMKGTLSDSYEDGEFNYTQKITYNLSVKKGWNELCSKIEDITVTSTTITIEESVTNDIPSGLTWQYDTSGKNVKGNKEGYGVRPLKALFVR